MTLNQFLTYNKIKPADAIVMKKKFFGMVDHYVIYLGVSNRNHVFVANYKDGVKLISDSEVREFLKFLNPTKIDRYPGPERLRHLAIDRAKMRIGEKSYNYVSNNCEHFKNWVHRGVHKSSQVDNAFEGVAVSAGVFVIAGLISTIFSRD